MDDECYFCGKQAYDDDFCHGCEVHVCEDCDLLSPIGPHQPHNHQRVDQGEDVQVLQIDGEA